MPEPKGAINAYLCPNGHATWTRNRDEGTTPAFIPCPAFCGADARSAWYRVPQDSDAHCAHEWYRPTDLTTLTPGERDHVDRGGLLLRHRINPFHARVPDLQAPEPYQRAVVERLGAKALIPKHLRAKPPKAKRRRKAKRRLT
ncbi:hypothetical protein [Alloactinosynnema sp. L-07]|uniref:hypothetical protein n=1 Tax=Alloactinosynnema sp. L-07 TaxID=1653480 RepID=UPI00065F02F2|nr:hypothetical protein [Alloactinosynnema sp. L-07]CRK59051.1 hypothetical protein [Alloactinosynnema sp. L-07]